MTTTATAQVSGPTATPIAAWRTARAADEKARTRDMRNVFVALGLSFAFAGWMLTSAATFALVAR